MLKKYMHSRERHFAMLNDNRVVRPFEWGTEYITDKPNGRDPRELFSEYAHRTVEHSDEFFFSPEIEDFKLDQKGSPPYEGGVGFGSPPVLGGVAAASADGVVGGRGGSLPPERQILTWTSSITTQSPENNTAVATWFPHETNRKAAVVVLPHWNARAGSYVDLCKFFSKGGGSGW
jgi:hypothetical protein